MGRVAKYKKIKSCDPYSKPNRSGSGGATGGPQQPRVSEIIWGATATNRKSKSQKRSAKATAMHDRKVKRREGKRTNKQQGMSGGGGGDDDGFDMPPTDGDDFHMSDLVGSVRSVKRRRLDDGLIDPNSLLASKKKEGDDKKGKADKANKAKAVPTAVAPTIPQTDREEAKVNRVLKLGKNANPSTSSGGDVNSTSTGKDGKSSSSTANKVQGRKDGESMRAFERRIKEETRVILMKEQAVAGSQLSSSNPEKKEKKKAYLKNRKMMKKKGKKGRRAAGGYGDDSDDSDDDRDYSGGGGDPSQSGGFVTGERAAAAVARQKAAATSGLFGESADRPPTFDLLPRGAAALAASRKEEEKKKQQVNKSSSHRGGGTEHERRIAAERRAMEVMREKVRDQYAQVKARRKKEGDFHL